MKRNMSELSDEDLKSTRKLCLRSLYYFCMAVMGYEDMREGVHDKYCRFLELDHQRKQITLPRGFIKTWIGSIAYPIWIALPRTEPDEFPEGISPDNEFYKLGPNIRILIASYVISNSMKMIGLICKTYERNQAMMILFPEVIPENFNKTKWSSSEACINRSEEFTEATFEAGGIGGSTTSRHYDMIIEDLIYAKKDDLSGKELHPNQEDIDKAIGWHKIATSLLVPKTYTRIYNIGTRWAKHDLIDYIIQNEPEYKIFHKAITKDGTVDGEPEWPEVYGKKKIDELRHSQGPWLFSTQYLNLPVAPEDMLFKQEWLQLYESESEIPKEIRRFTTVDLSGWTEPKRKDESRGVVLTCGIDSRNHIWILHYDVGRFDPSKVIDLLYKHNNLFKPEYIGVEEVYYQKSLLFFARKEMETRGWLNVRGLKTDSSISKELRIRALEPYASNLAIHCKKSHKDFIEEYSEYVPNSRLCKKDILDALAYQIQLAKPGEVSQEENRRNRIKNVQYGILSDDILEWAWKQEKDKITSPFVEDEFEDTFEDFNINTDESMVKFMEVKED
jgi:hypothetical protein